VAKAQPHLTEPNMLAALACLGGFWWFLYQAADAKGKNQPPWIRWATWW
jgi:hypothetical protein